jgi:tetratricopeptide (TPR) repeat protein
MTDRFDQLLGDARAAFERGEMERASELASAAESLARDALDEERADRALCTHFGYELQLGRGAERISVLKQILLRTSCPTNRYLAAYYTAVAYYDLIEDADKAYSYADRAYKLAAELDNPLWLAGSANFAGNLAMQRSDFSEAESHYRAALDGYPTDDHMQRIMAAQIRDNIGYILMCTDRLDDGIAHCEDALCALEDLDAEHYMHTVLQDLCYGYTLNDRLDRARTCGERGLELAIEFSDELIAKNCLFLLSEIAVRQGDTFRARRYLRELIAHYPEVGVSDEIVDVFLSTDLTTVVNLRG